MVYKVILEHAEEGGFTVYCPALPGCISEGDSREEAVANIQEAVRLYLRALERENQMLVDKGEVEIVEVAV
jgi:predicted RNase H-like HicB family nuclease